MSTIYSVVGKLEALITENHVAPKVEELVKEVLSSLTDKTKLFIEWNEIDVQAVAREKLSFMGDCTVDEIIDNPLSREDVKNVIEFLDDHMDCNYGITWETISCAIDNCVQLPASDCCRKEIKDDNDETV